jgi:hypothetical protein
MVLGSGELRELREEVGTAVYTLARSEVSLRADEFGEAVQLVDAILGQRRGV